MLVLKLGGRELSDALLFCKKCKKSGWEFRIGLEILGIEEILLYLRFGDCDFYRGVEFSGGRLSFGYSLCDVLFYKFYRVFG